MKRALIIIDIQRDYFPGGKMEVFGSVEAAGAAAGLLGHFREKKLPVVHVQHISIRPGAGFLLPDTEGVNFHEKVLPLSGEKIVQKYSPNSFLGTDLQAHLEAQGIKELVVCGMMSQMCIDATVRAAFDLGYRCIVAHDACAARGMAFNGVEITAPQVHGAYMAALGMVYAKVVSAREITG